MTSGVGKALHDKSKPEDSQMKRDILQIISRNSFTSFSIGGHRDDFGTECVMIFLQPVVPIHRVHQGKCVLKQHKQSAHSVHFEHELPLSVCRGTRESINLRHYPGYKSK